MRVVLISLSLYSSVNEQKQMKKNNDWKKYFIFLLEAYHAATSVIFPAGGGGNSYLFIDKVSMGNLDATRSNSAFIKGVSKFDTFKAGRTGSR